jgi:chemotaxis protein methyltransferase CheR
MGAAAAMALSSTVALLKQIRDHLRYRYRLWFQPRTNVRYTQFYRFPHQYRALLEHVLPQRLGADPSLASRPLEIVIFACSTGEEAYTLAHLLRKQLAGGRFRIRAFDIVEESIRTACEGAYTKEQVYAGPFISEELVSSLFERSGERYLIRPEVRKSVSFDLGDMTDGSFVDTLGRCDFVFAQNVIFHLPPAKAPTAFENVYKLLRPGGTLFINGVDTAMRIKLTKKFKLEPVRYLLEEIHADARVDRGATWANQYWGREPFSKRSRDWPRKFGTIFTRES